MFQLHPQLEKDSFLIRETSLCEIRLINNALFPWVILVPKHNEIKEFLDLSPQDQQTLWQDITHISKKMQQHYNPDKLNVAMLGNMVPQLHIHIIARFKEDTAWPNPIWGNDSKPYTKKEKNNIISKLSTVLQ